MLFMLPAIGPSFAPIWCAKPKVLFIWCMLRSGDPLAAMFGMCGPLPCMGIIPCGWPWLAPHAGDMFGAGVKCGWFGPCAPCALIWWCCIAGLGCMCGGIMCGEPMCGWLCIPACGIWGFIMPLWLWLWCKLCAVGMSSNGFDATIVSPNVLIGGGGSRSCGVGAGGVFWLAAVFLLFFGCVG